MKTSRTVLLMLASLAGGTGVRLAFSLPAEAQKPHRRPSGETASPAAPNQSPAPAARPPESEILTATGGPRLRLLLAWLPAAGGEELLRMAEALYKPEAQKGPALSLLMARWAEVNPDSMLDWAESKDDGDSWLYHDAVTAWARVDFDSAWAGIDAARPGLCASALRGLVWSDPDKCLRLLTGRTDLIDSRRFSSMDEVFKRLLRHNPAGVAALLDGACTPADPLAIGDRTALAADVALAWAKSDPAAALAWITKLEPQARTRALQDAGVWLAEHTPEQVPAFLQHLPAGPARCAIEAASLTHLAATDLDAARRRLDSMPASPARQYGRGLLLKELVNRGDDAGALALATQLGWNFRDEWIPRGHETVVEDPSPVPRPLFSEFPGEESLTVHGAMVELIDRIAARDPQQAAALLAQKGEDARWFISGKAESRPAKLAEVLFAAGDEKSQDNLRTLVDQWADEDPAAAANWALAHSGPQTDSLPSSILKYWHSDVDAALAWAGDLPPAQRFPLLREAVQSWHDVGDIDVEGAVRASALPAEEKQQLLDALTAP